MIDKSIVELLLPAGALIMLINRDGGQIVPNGATVLKAEDSLLVVGNNEALAMLDEIAQNAAVEVVEPDTKTVSEEIP